MMIAGSKCFNIADYVYPNQTQNSEFSKLRGFSYPIFLFVLLNMNSRKITSALYLFTFKNIQCTIKTQTKLLTKIVYFDF